MTSLTRETEWVEGRNEEGQTTGPWALGRVVSQFKEAGLMSDSGVGEACCASCSLASEKGMSEAFEP